MDVLEPREEQVDELVAEFDDWAAGRGLEVDLFVVEAALDARVPHVEVLLLEWFPRKATLERPHWSGVLTTLHHWADFLTATRGDEEWNGGELHAAIDRSAPEFLARMADERNYGPAKFWATRMIEHGVDPEDEDDVRDFLLAVQGGAVEYDEDVLAEIMRRHADGGGADLLLPEFGGGAPGPLPPVPVPPDGELAALAEATGVVTRLRTLVTWVGAGRAVTTTKHLLVADARELAVLLGLDEPGAERARGSEDLPEVSLLVAWARAVRLVRVVKGRLVAVKSAAGLLDRPVELWWRAFEAYGGLGPEACAPASRHEAPSPLGLALREVLLDLWLGLYPAGGAPVPVELLAESAHHAVSAWFEVGGLPAGAREVMWRRDFAAVLGALAVLGVVELAVSADAEEHAEIIELSGNDDPDLTLARLTPLGRWAVQRALRAEGFDAPSVEEFAQFPLEEVCEAVEPCAPEVAEPVLAAWVAARDAGEAAAELAAFCVDGPSAEVRLLAWAALEHAGAPGAEQARRLRSAGVVPTEWPAVAS
ncbi:hypothetical protein ACVDFE_38320 [Lentzea chajnantorensis]